MVWELVGRNTDVRETDVRWRSYTTSQKRAELWEKIPKLQFSDSGHGVIFEAIPHKGKRKTERPVRLGDYPDDELRRLVEEDRKAKKK